MKNLILAVLLSPLVLMASNPNKAKSDEYSGKGASFVFLVGANFAKVHDPEFDPSDLDAGEKIKMKAGVLTGIGVNIAFNRYISLQPELVFSQKGLKHTFVDGADRATYTETYNYMELPIMIHGGYSTKKFEAYAALGPTIGFWASGKTKLVVIEDGDKEVEKEKLDLKDNGGSYTANRIEAGIKVGAGAGYKIKGLVLGVELGGNIGLTGLEKRSKDASGGTPKPVKLTNRMLYLAFYLRLGKSK